MYVCDLFVSVFNLLFVHCVCVCVCVYVCPLMYNSFTIFSLFESMAYLFLCVSSVCVCVCACSAFDVSVAMY